MAACGDFNEEDVGDPLPDDELQEEQEGEVSEDDDRGGSDAGAEDLSTDPVRPILLVSQYTAPTRPRARVPGDCPSMRGAFGPASSALNSRGPARCSGRTTRANYEK